MNSKAPFIIKKDKYSLSIIKNNKYSSSKKTGISIFKKTLELNELNEDNINMILKNSKKEDIIYSYANIGFISIVGLLSFAYCKEEDIKKIGEINSISIYQILNIRYIICNSDQEDEENNTFLKAFTKYEINNCLLFAEFPLMLDYSFDNFLFIDIYKVEQNICHLSPDIIFCYNNDILAYFRKFNLIDFVTHLVGGFYYSIKESDFTIHFIVKELDLRDSKEKVYKSHNQKVLKEIEIVMTSNFQNFHFGFYCLIDKYLDLLNDNELIYNLLKKNQPDYKKDNGALLIIDMKNKLKEKNDSQINDIITNIKNHLDSELGNNNRYLFIKTRDKIDDFIEKNINRLDEVIYNFEYKKLDLLQLQAKSLLIITDNENNSLDIIENILLRIKYKYLSESGELSKKKIIVNSLEKIINSFRIFIDARNKNIAKQSMMIHSEPVNDEYLNNNIFKNNQSNKSNIDDNKNSNSNNYTNSNDKTNNNNIDDNNINDNINIHKIINNKEKKLENKIKEDKNIISVYIVTNNVNCYKLDDFDSELTLKKLLYPNYLKERLSENNLPTFFCIGLQEIVKLNTSNIIFSNNKDSVETWEKKITQLLQKNYNYSLQYREDLVGVLFLVFVKGSEAKHITDIKRSVKKSGFLNTLGNKGYIIYEFTYKKKTFAFCTGHLTAGEKTNNSQDRINQLTDILKFQNDKNSKRIFENDFYFLFGDMNFRVRVDKKEFYDEINKLSSPDLRKSNANSLKRSLIISSEDMFDKQKNMLNTPLNSKKEKNNLRLSYNKKGIDDKSYDNNDLQDCSEKINESQFRNYFLTKHLENEELTGIKDKLKIYQVNEHEIKFLPSYKYIKGYDYYNISKRIPSWTDRILFKDTKDIKCLCYDKIDVNYSDHKPVYALFELYMDNEIRKK